MTREQAIEKLKRLKALVDRPGTEGEREAALNLYNSLLEKYQLEKEEVAAEIKKRWFRFKTKLERQLLLQVFYAVTGDSTYWYRVDGRLHDIGVECTEAEAIEIEFLFNFYREAMTKELEVFVSAFISANRIYPNHTARIQEKPEERKLTQEEKEKQFRAGLMANGINKSVPPRALIEE